MRKQTIEDLIMPDEEKPDITITQTPTAGKRDSTHFVYFEAVNYSTLQEPKLKQVN